jgi:chromosome segregation ATPase
MNEDQIDNRAENDIDTLWKHIDALTKERDDLREANDELNAELCKEALRTDEAEALVQELEGRMDRVGTHLGEMTINYAREFSRADKAEDMVGKLKKKLYLEGVKNNSDRARTEFLEDKLEEVEKVIEAAREWATSREYGISKEGMQRACDSRVKLMKAIFALDSEGRK